MRCIGACQTELAIRMLDEILLPNFEVEFLVESKSLARRLHDSGLNVIYGDLRRTDTYVKADLSPSTCVVVEDNGRRSLKKILEAIWDAGGTLVYVLGVGTSHTRQREEDLKAQFPELNYLALSELFGGPFPPGVRPIADALARPAVPALFQRRRPRPDPAPQRSRPGCDGERPRAAHGA